MQLYFRPEGSRYGTEIIAVGSGPIGGTNLIGGASPLTANTTTKFHIPAPYRRCAFLRLSAFAVTVPADADGTLLARLVKYDNATNAEIILSGDINLEGLVTRETAFADTIAGLADVDRVLKDGDSLCINVVSNSAAIDTQPANLLFAVELAVLR